MSDVSLVFDIEAGKNELPLEIDRISKAAKYATEQIKNTTKESKNLGDSLKETGGARSFEGVSKGAKDSSLSLFSLASKATLAVGAVTSVIYRVKQMTEAAIESEESVSNLELSLKQTGIYSESASNQLQDLAASIQETTIYSDDQVMATQSMLQNLGQFTKEGLIKATKATVDLASAMKIDLNSAALLVGKAASGNVAAFQRMGIEIKKGKDDSETFSNTLEALAKFEGDADTKARTLGGSFKYLGNQVGEVSETVSKYAVEILNLKEITYASAQGVKAINEEIKKNPKESIFTSLSIASRIANKDITLFYDAYKLLKDDVEKNPIRARITAEESISKQSAGVQSLFSLSPNNLAPQAPAQNLIGDIAKASAESSKLLLDTKARQEEINKKSDEERVKQRKAYDELLKQVINAGKTEEQIISDETTLRLRGANDLLKSRAISEKEFADLKIQIEKDYYQKIEKLDDESREKGLKAYEEDLKKKEELRKKQEESFAKIANASLGAATNVLQGEAGARTLISGGIGAASEAFAPGTGQAASALASQLMQGPEANREMIKQFAAAVPELVKGIVDSIPVIIEELANQFPRVIDSMVNKFQDPKFIESITKAFIKAGIAMAKGFVQSMINFIPDFFKDFGKELISAIVDGVNQAVGSVGDIAGNAIGSIPIVGDAISTVGDWLGFAKGGQVNSVPQGFPNDTFPAMLSSGELVVDRSTVNRLNEMMDEGQSQGSGVSEAILVKILDKLSEPINVATTATLNGKALADIILQLNRNNARLTV